MDTLIILLKDHQIGTWCKRAAWIVLFIGLVEIALNIYNYMHQFGLAGQPLNSGIVLEIIGLGLGNLTSVLFYFFILYAAGALLNRFVGVQPTDDEIEEDEDAVLHP